MSSSLPAGKTRSERVATVAPVSRWRSWYERLRESIAVAHIVMCVLVAIGWWLVLGAWSAPFPFRVGDLPPRDITARVAFSVPNAQKTEQQRRRRRSETLVVYVNDPRSLDELRSRLKTELLKLVDTKDIAKLTEKEWRPFLVRPGTPSSQKTPVDPRATVERLRKIFQEKSAREQWAKALEALFEPLRQHGLLEQLDHDPEDGSQLAIRVYPEGRPRLTQQVSVDEIDVKTQVSALEKRLPEELKKAGFAPEDAQWLSRLVMNWIGHHGLPVTLKLDPKATEEAYAPLAAMASVEDHYQPGDRLAEAYRPLSRETVWLLRAEHRAWEASHHWLHWIGYSMASLGWYAAIFVLCGVYIAYHHRELLTDFRRIAATLVLMLAVVGAARLAAADTIRAELLPVLLFGMTMRVVFPRELSLLLVGVITVLITMGLGQGLAEWLISVGAVFAAVLSLNRIHTRTKLLYVGMGAGLIALMTTIGVGILTEQTYGVAGTWRWWHEPETGMIGGSAYLFRLLSGATWHGFGCILAGLVMTGLLPAVERLFDVQTDIRLLEIGDPRHELMQELARRAPGTFSHSLTVASLAEAAAQAIGANGLLVRVGAYFHDIGKMLNPEYFVENQTAGVNRHEALAPAMSTLVIIAHVKDGINLARQYRLPKSIISFIEQHHGTTVIEFFYREATRHVEENPELPKVEETDFRYPGPKPQTREAAILMIADSAESASRTLVDPAPARIQTLVHDLIMKKLNDGQFDECGLTLKELATVESTLVKSLTALYHGRIKYPGEAEKRA